MSKPKYLRKDVSPNSIIMVVENTLGYLFQITNNEKQFPKAYRYTLVTEIRNTCLHMYRSTYKALSIKPRYLEQYEKRSKYREEVYNDILDLNALMIIATKVVTIKNPEYIANMMDELIKSFNKWTKNDKRQFKSLLPETEYRLSCYKKHKPKYDRDENGFIILRYKDRSKH